MGLFGGLSNLGKRIFSKRGAQSFLGSAGGLLPGVQEFMLTDKGNKLYEDIHKGLGNLVSGGYIGQREAAAQARRPHKTPSASLRGRRQRPRLRLSALPTSRKNACARWRG